MKKYMLFVALLTTCLSVWSQPKDYVWDTPSRNSSESMPCGGGDVGMNVWMEDGDILFYLSRSGSFDENNTLLKAGRFRISLTDNWIEPMSEDSLYLNIWKPSGQTE